MSSTGPSAGLLRTVWPWSWTVSPECVLRVYLGSNLKINKTLMQVQRRLSLPEGSAEVPALEVRSATSAGNEMGGKGRSVPPAAPRAFPEPLPWRTHPPSRLPACNPPGAPAPRGPRARRRPEEALAHPPRRGRAGGLRRPRHPPAGRSGRSGPRGRAGAVSGAPSPASAQRAVCPGRSAPLPARPRFL